MAIIDSELNFYYPENISNTTANGGRMTANLIPSGQANNVWPSVTVAERLAGVTTKRKVFAKNCNAAKLTLSAAKLWIDNPTPADGFAFFALASQIDTEADWLATEPKYGAGTLNTDVIATGLTLIVDLEDNTLKSGDDALFRVGETIRITDKLLPTSTTGAEEYLTIDTVTPHATDPQVTLTVTTALVNDYTVAAGTRVASVAEVASVVATSANFVVTSAAGTYDNTLYPLDLENESTIEESWTFDFTDATNYTCTGSVTGSVGSGVIGTDFAPANPDFAKQYFLLAAAGFGGTFAAGDSITVDTSPASVPIVETHVTPAGAASYSGNKVTVVFTGESA